MAATFSNITMAGSSTDGRLDVAADKVVWHSSTRDARHAVDMAAVKDAAWYDFARSCQLWLFDKAGNLTRFDGFKLTDYDRVNAAIAAFTGRPVDKRAVAAAGGNWGSMRLNGKVLEWVDASGKLIAPIPLSSISQSAHPASHEIELHFLDEEIDRGDEACLEMRLWVPDSYKLADEEAARKAAKERSDARKARTKAAAGAGVEGGSDGKADGEDGVGEGEEEDDTPAFALHSLLTHATGTGGTTAEPIVDLPEDVGQFLVPRGRFAIEMFPTFMRLIGRTYEFKIAYKSIGRFFYLPKPSTTGKSTITFLMITLEEPLRHGNQRHPHLVMQLKNEDMTVDLNLTDEDVAAGRFEGLGKESKTMVGGQARIVAQLLRAITGKAVFKPGDFRSSDGGQAVRCSCKSNDGLLYPLDRSFVFVHKPAHWIRFQDVESAEIARASAGGTGRTVDLILSLKSVGGSEGETITFQSIDSREKDALRVFLQSKEVVVIEEAVGKAAKLSDALHLDDDDDDDEDASGGGEDEDESEDEDFDLAKEEAAVAGKKRKRGEGGSGGGGGSGDDDGDGDAGSDDDDAGSDDDDEDDDTGFRRKKGGKKSSKKAGGDKGKAAKGGKRDAKRKRRDSDDD